ncbi:hypothetical protein EVAR_54890_1 [Eumeta japonica]|uniref:Uncharacterized protein n=1 Tax=Eumeta variegata TaxID=151549 RepID=A0A4C1ZVI4_EUMVA|nr:hypothetical protein EVAR_54890_1 [Eumeta japonica]
MEHLKKQCVESLRAEKAKLRNVEMKIGRDRFLVKPLLKTLSMISGVNNLLTPSSQLCRQQIEKTGNALVTPLGLRASMSGGDQLLSDSSPTRLFLYLAVKKKEMQILSFNLHVFTNDRRQILISNRVCVCVCAAGVRTVDVQAVEGMAAQFPCELGAVNDKVYMVLWFRDDAGIPLYRCPTIFPLKSNQQSLHVALKKYISYRSILLGNVMDERDSSIEILFSRLRGEAQRERRSFHSKRQLASSSLRMCCLSKLGRDRRKETDRATFDPIPPRVFAERIIN